MTPAFGDLASADGAGRLEGAPEVVVSVPASLGCSVGGAGGAAGSSAISSMAGEGASARGGPVPPPRLSVPPRRLDQAANLEPLADARRMHHSLMVSPVMKDRPGGWQRRQRTAFAVRGPVGIIQPPKRLIVLLVEQILEIVSPGVV